MSIIDNTNSTNLFVPRIGIFGGTFNPIHNSHIKLAISAAKEFNLEKVMMVVSGNPPHKKNIIIPDKEYRYKMTQLACKKYPILVPNKYEVDRNEYSYTHNTLKYFKSIYSKYELYFILGEDALFDIEKWKYPNLIMKLAKILVAKRIGSHYNKNIKEQISYLCDKYNTQIFMINQQIDYISSTILRDKLSKNLNCNQYMANEVIEYIYQNQLY